MTTLVITVNVANPDGDDRTAMNYAIAQENVVRASLGQAALPNSTAAERKSSHEAILAAKEMKDHLNMISTAIQAADKDAQFQELKRRWFLANSTQKDASLAQLPST